MSQAGVRVRSLSKNSTSEELVTSTWSSSKSIPLPWKNSPQFNLNLAVASALSLMDDFVISAPN
jgi:hypothetical protein